MTFLDHEGQQIEAYNPLDRERKGPIHEIAANEELIGVYGVQDKSKKDKAKRSKYLLGFGLIVKVKPSSSLIL